MIWSDAHRPTRLEDMVGNEEARITVAKWLLMWVDGTRPLLLIGPPGVGKTTIVKVLAYQYDYDLIELNASDTRSKLALMEVVLPILRNKSLLTDKVILFLDEIDGISGRHDAGGVESLLTLLKEPTVPIVMAANTKDTKIKGIAKHCKIVELSRVHPSLLLLHLGRVLELEEKEMDYEDMLDIVRNANGDLRSTLNIAQGKLCGYDSMGSQSYEIDVSRAIPEFSTSITIDYAREILTNSKLGYFDPRFGQSAEERRNDILYAFFSSIVNSDFGIEQIADTLEIISKCDLILGKASEKRHWAVLKYLHTIFPYRILQGLKGRKLKYSQYSLPWPISSSLISRRAALKELEVGLVREAHASASILSATYLPYLFHILSCNEVNLTQFVEGLGVDSKVAESLSKELGKRPS